MVDLKTKYNKTVLPALKDQFGYKNNLEAPRILKIVVNIGSGRLKDDKIASQEIVRLLSLITGQKSSPRQSKKSIASFKTRTGMVIGYKVTLRRKMMYDFLDKLINISLPRMRDFRGLNSKFIDEGGNLNLGFKEYTSFPEIIGEDFKNIYGLEISIVTNAASHKNGLEFFKLLGFPFQKS